MNYVLDAYPLVAFFEKQSAATATQALLARAVSGGPPLLLTTVNWGEVYYVTARSHGLAAAERVVTAIEALPIEVVPADLALSRQAAAYKAAHAMSYADCFAAALAKLQGATLVTGDREFKQVEKEIKLLWV